MEFIFKHRHSVSAKISIILVDWSCRESFHTLYYLNHQTIPREYYEILWIECYNRRAPQIEKMLKDTAREGKHPAVDQWIVLQMPENTYYHKHLMYNVGILSSRGDILVICDSDAMVKPTFVESILEDFEKNQNIVLHLDEVRNNDKHFYPFNFPTFEEVLGEGVVNWQDGKTTGILDRIDPIHTRNYGACMCALREDLIEIGGADEHIDYLGHVCGPYEMTFRLVNAGKTERWHESEFLFHTWHPSTDGQRNYLGPHDGKNMSVTALDVIRTGRVGPLVENSAIQSLRLSLHEMIYAPPLEYAIPKLELPNWTVHHAKSVAHQRWPLFPKLHLDPKSWGNEFLMIGILSRIAVKQLRLKIQSYSASKVMKKSFFDIIRIGFNFIGRMWRNNIYIKFACEQLLDRLSQEGIREVSIYGNGMITTLLTNLVKGKPINIQKIYPRPCNQSLSDKEGKIIIASLTEVIDQINELELLGVNRDNIIRLQ